MIGVWPDMQRQSASDWLMCSSGDTERSCSLLVHMSSTESCNHQVVFAKYFYISFLAISLLFWLMFMKLLHLHGTLQEHAEKFKNIQGYLKKNQERSSFLATCGDLAMAISGEYLWYSPAISLK